MRRPQSITSAAPTSTFFGSHPRRAQVPPNGLESTIATCHPAKRHRDATADAAAPVPIATRSNFFITVFLYMKPRPALLDLETLLPLAVMGYVVTLLTRSFPAVRRGVR